MKIFDAVGFSSKLTGSFSGSFIGDGSELIGTISSSIATTASYIKLSNVDGSASLSSRIFTNSASIASLETVSGSYANSASFASSISANSASIGSLNSVSGSYANSSSFASNISANSASIGSLNAISGSYANSASFASDISSNSASIGSLNAVSSSYLLNTTDTLTGDLTVTGNIIATTLNVQDVTASVIYSSGSNIFGSSSIDTQQFTGSILTSGSIEVNGDKFTVSGATGNTVVGGTLNSGAITSTSTGTFGGSITITGGTTNGLNITTSGTQDTIKINRAATSDNAITKYQTSSTDKWIVGLRNTSDDNFRFYNYGTSIDSLIINTSGTIIGTGVYSGSGSVKIFEAQRNGGAVAADWSYDDATTDMSLGTSTAHSFSLKTGNTRALTISNSQNTTFAGNVIIPTGKELIIGSQTAAGSPLGITIRDDQGNVPVGIQIHNENTGTGADAAIAFETQGAMDFSIGLDRSDSSKFVMSRAGTLGTNNVFTIDGTTATFAVDIIPSAENLYDIGSASVRWEDIWADQVYGRSVYVDDNIYHNGDTDTYIAFAADRQTYLAGGDEFIDFREATESYITLGNSNDTDTRMQGGAGYIFIQGSNGYIGINDATPSYPFEVNGNTFIGGTLQTSGDVTVAGKLDITGVSSFITHGTAWGTNLKLTNTNDDASPPILTFFKNGASPANNDYVGFINYRMDNSNGDEFSYVEVAARAVDITDGSEDSQYTIGTWGAGTEYPTTIIAKSGNVGIGEPNPNYKLNVASGTNTDGIYLSGLGNAMSNGEYRQLQFGYSDTDTSYGSTIRFVVPDAASHGGQIEFYTDAGPGSTTSLGTLALGMFIDPRQNVGIGTNTIPTDIYTASGGGYATLKMGQSSFLTAYKADDSIELCQNTYLNTGGANNAVTASVPAARLTLVDGQFVFATLQSAANYSQTAINAVKINTDGTIFIGQTDTNLGYATHHISKDASQSYALIVRNSNTSTSNNSVLQLNQAETTSTTAGYLIIGRQGDTSSGTNRFFVYSNGDVKNTNNVYGQISDERKKENIIDASPKLNDLMKVKVKNFNFKGDDLKQIGVVAQELEEIFPGMISESKDPDSEDETLYKSVKYSVFVPMLIKSIQEQQVILNELKAEIEILKNK